MELIILDDQFKSIYVLDEFESLIWTERYDSAGNFEFYTPVNDSLLDIANYIRDRLERKIDTYAWLQNADSTMIIEDLQIYTDVETGGHLTISGRGLESILERRIIWTQTVLNGNLQGQIKKLLDQNAISPLITDRKIPNLIFEQSSDPRITALTIKAQYTGDNLYDTIFTICDSYSIGFRIILDNQNRFVFSLYMGEDRSYNQTANPYVVFSPKYENMINSNYIESIKTLKNVTLVAGEDEGANRKTRTVGSGSGMARRELYTDARDIQSQYHEGDQEVVLTPAEYNALLDQRGKEKLSENGYTKAFTGEIEATKSFIYGVDFFKGDIVQVMNEYKIESTVRVSELVRVYDTTGFSMYPTFEVID